MKYSKLLLSVPASDLTEDELDDLLELAIEDYECAEDEAETHC